MNNLKNLHWCLAVAMAFMLGYVSTASAQFITWQPSVPLFDPGLQTPETIETFIDTTGDVAVAMNVTTPGQATTNMLATTVTLNGVTFTPSGNGAMLEGPGGEFIMANPSTFVDDTGVLAPGIGSNGGAFRAGQFDADATNNPGIFNLLRGAAFRIQSITLGGLTVGQQYRIQAIVQDGRNTRSTDFLTGFGDGSGSATPVAIARLSNQAPGLAAPIEDNGDSIIGTFTADLGQLDLQLVWHGHWRRNDCLSGMGWTDGPR